MLAAVVLVSAVAAASTAASARRFPDWSSHLRLWPFDVLYPGTSTAEIGERLDVAAAAGANTTIVYVEEEHMYGTFVDETGFAGVLGQLGVLTHAAHARGLRVMVYLNGLEVMTHDAVDPSTCAARQVTTMARAHPGWLQLDLEGEPIVDTCLELEWLTPDMEDAWVSPFSPYRDLFVRRIGELATAGVDAVYIDATFLPGLQPDEESLRWGTTDPLASAAFTASTGLDIPDEEDWADPVWRAWIAWRHEVVREYLADLAEAAWTAGVVPFWESSSNDTTEGTVLGNETAVTARNAMGFSPEIEPEGDWGAAFRMAQFARDVAPDHPVIYLGWPEDAAEAGLQVATAMAFSDNIYPTADAAYPDWVFTFADELRSRALGERRPEWGHVALVYSVRNKDWTFPEEAHFSAYEDAYRDLVAAHLPFRVLVLENLDPSALAPFDTVVLPHLSSLSDAEHALLGTRGVILRGEVGTRDETWAVREQPLSWPHLLDADPDDLESGLPFALEAPATSRLSFTRARDGSLVVWVVDSSPGGTLELSGGEVSTVSVLRPGRPPEEVAGATVRIALTDPITVILTDVGRSDREPPRRPGGRIGGVAP